ncbi:hypothetical protein ScPMuIL_000576 [Solemya velum]
MRTKTCIYLCEQKTYRDTTQSNPMVTKIGIDLADSSTENRKSIILYFTQTNSELRSFFTPALHKQIILSHLGYFRIKVYYTLKCSKHVEDSIPDAVSVMKAATCR